MNVRNTLRLLCLSWLPVLTSVDGASERDLSGAYLYIQETTSVTKMPFLADVVATTRAVSIQQLRHENGWLRGTGELCDVRMSTSSKLVKTTLPRAFRQAIPPVRTNAKITRHGRSLKFEQPAQTLVLGAKLKNKAKEKLPVQATDPRVSDDDQDGHPGVTVKVSGIISGEIYVIQRSTSWLTGHSTPQGFHGKITFTNDQKIIGASRNVLRRDPGAQPDPSRSTFLLRKLPRPISCAEAIAIARR